MNCPKCNAPVEDGVNFCTHCGANIKLEDEQPVVYQPYNKPPQQEQQQQYNTNPYTQQQPFNPNPYTQQQMPGTNQYYQQQPMGFPGQQGYTGPIQRPTGVTLILLYELIFGLFLLLMGGTLFTLNTETLNQVNQSIGFTYTLDLFHMIGILFLGTGLIGLIGAILFYQWKSIGYIITIIFLVITGILFFSLYLIPLIIMIVSLYYFLRNQKFKYTFNYMKNQKKMKSYRY